MCARSLENREGGKYDRLDEAIKPRTRTEGKPFFVYLAARGAYAAGGEARGCGDLPEEGDTGDAASECNVCGDGKESGAWGGCGDLAEKGLEQNTVFVFTSDNGDAELAIEGDDAGDQQFPIAMGKGSLYEGGLRVPLLAGGDRKGDHYRSTGDSDGSEK